MYLLADKDFVDIASWTPDGKKFTIYNPKEFESKVLPKYFKESKFSSFLRKLYRWGFSKRSDGVDGARLDRNSPTYFHEKFQKDNFDLCAKMSCSNKGHKVVSHPHVFPEPHERYIPPQSFPREHHRVYSDRFAMYENMARMHDMMYGRVNLREQDHLNQYTMNRMPPMDNGSVDARMYPSHPGDRPQNSLPAQQHGHANCVLPMDGGDQIRRAMMMNHVHQTPQIQHAFQHGPGANVNAAGTTMPQQSEAAMLSLSERGGVMNHQMNGGFPDRHYYKPPRQRANQPPDQFYGGPPHDRRP